MNLFLASSLDQTLPLLWEHHPQVSPKGARVLFVANAADPFPDAWWITADREAFQKAGAAVTECDLREHTAATFAHELATHNIVHFGGGSVFVLMNLLRERGLVAPLTDSVRSGKILYSGTSAGSIIVAPTLRLFLHDPEEKKFARADASHEGLALVNFLIIPHCNNPEFTAANLAVVEHLAHERTPLICLYDHQAVVVREDGMEIVEA